MKRLKVSGATRIGTLFLLFELLLLRLHCVLFGGCERVISKGAGRVLCRAGSVSGEITVLRTGPEAVTH